jgi:hypothetical protein
MYAQRQQLRPELGPQRDHSVDHREVGVGRPQDNNEPQESRGDYEFHSARPKRVEGPHLNRGTAFTVEESEALGFPGVAARGCSVARAGTRSYDQYLTQPTDLAKNDFLAALHDRNECSINGCSRSI